MNIVNDRPVMIFKKDNKYTIGVSKKNQNGEYEKAYFPIQFNKDVEIDDKTLIILKTAWLSFYKWEYQDKKGTTFFIRCSEFEKANQFDDLHITTASDIGQQIEITDEDLPF